MTSSDSRKQRKAEEKTRRRADREIITLELDYDPADLAFNGPIINTDLTITDSHKEALIQAGETVPPPVRCRFLIDTGADGSFVGHEFAERAGLKLINPNAPIVGIGVDSTGKAYLGRISFIIPSKTVSGGKHSVHIDTQIASGTLEPNVANKIDGLIGRDVLHYFDFNYNGRTGKVIMKYLR